MDSSRGFLGCDVMSYHNTTRCNNPEDLDLNLHRRENVKCRLYEVVLILEGRPWERFTLRVTYDKVTLEW